MMTYNYKISFDDGRFIKLDRNEPIDVDALNKERWAVMKSPTEVYYLNITHITMIQEWVNE